jgi:hypothetical protein
MIIDITLTDLWNEFIYWRKNGNPHVAFDYLRREHDTSYYEALLAMIAYRKTDGKVDIGDTIQLVKYSIFFRWDEELKQAFVEGGWGINMC